MFDKETIELFSRAGALLAGAFSVIMPLVKVWLGWSGRLYQRRRDDYKFVRDFLADRKEVAHPYLDEHGIRAVVGHEKFSAPEIDALLASESPLRNMTWLGYGRRYIQFDRNSQLFEYRGWVAGAGYRRFKLVVHSVLYFLLAIAALAPLFFTGDMLKAHTDWKTIVTLVVTGLFGFGPIAWVNLIALRDLSVAKRLIESQGKKSQERGAPSGTVSATPITACNQSRDQLPMT